MCLLTDRPNLFLVILYQSSLDWPSPPGKQAGHSFLAGTLLSRVLWLTPWGAILSSPCLLFWVGSAPPFLDERMVYPPTEWTAPPGFRSSSPITSLSDSVLLVSSDPLLVPTPASGGLWTLYFLCSEPQLWHPD